MTIEKLEALEKAATAGSWYVAGSLTQEECPPNGKIATIVIGEPATGEDEYGVVVTDILEDVCDDDLELIVAARNALGPLLAVAKAAKLVKAANARRANAQVQDRCVREDYEQSMGHACDQLTRALEQLEATP